MKKVTFDSAVEEYVKICDAAHEVTRDPEDFGRIMERVKIRVLSDEGHDFQDLLGMSERAYVEWLAKKRLDATIDYGDYLPAEPTGQNIVKTYGCQTYEYTDQNSVFLFFETVPVRIEDECEIIAYAVYETYKNKDWHNEEPARKGRIDDWKSLSEDIREKLELLISLGEEGEEGEEGQEVDSIAYFLRDGSLKIELGHNRHLLI